MKLQISRVSILFLLILPAGWSLPTQAQTKYVVKVKGLSCPFCAYGLEKKLTKVQGVESVSIHLEKDEAVVTSKSGVAIDEASLRKAVRAAGFSIESLKKVEAEAGSPQADGVRR